MLKEPKSEPLTVLLVEDHEFLRTLFVQAFADTFIIHAATGARKGWQLFLDHEPDIAFLDVKLPDGNGYDLARRMKQARPLTHVIITTAGDDRDKSTVIEKDQLDGFILKPFDKTIIDGYIAQCLADRRVRLA